MFPACLSVDWPERNKTPFFFFTYFVCYIFHKVFNSRPFVMSQRAPFRQHYMPSVCLTCSACRVLYIAWKVEQSVTFKSAVFFRAVITSRLPPIDFLYLAWHSSIEQNNKSLSPKHVSGKPTKKESEVNMPEVSVEVQLSPEPNSCLFSREK